MGGEPTRYGHHQDHRLLLEVIRTAKQLGYRRIRIDANGQFPTRPLDQDGFAPLDEISISLDGHTPGINDPLRGHGSFTRCVASLTAAVKRGYRTHVTACIHSGNVGQDDQGRYLIDPMIRFVAGLGAECINFHGIFRHGVPRDTWIEHIWIEDTHVSSEQYTRTYTAVRAAIQAGESAQAEGAGLLRRGVVA